MFLSVFFGCARHYENKGEAKVLRASKEEGAKANATNEQIRSAAERDGAAERVRNKFCRDCWKSLQGLASSNSVEKWQVDGQNRVSDWGK